MKLPWLALALLLAACDAGRTAPASDHTITVTDDNGANISLGRPATRVIALVPSATAIIDALQKHAVLIGRVQEDSMAQLVSLPSVGRVLDPSIESIVALAPDLVVAWADADAVLERLAQASVPVYAARFARLQDITPNIRRIGALIGETDRADLLADQIDSKITTLATRQWPGNQPRVLYLLDSDPLWTAGPATFVDDLIRLAGGTNAFADLPVPWSQISLEAVLDRQPDVIIVAQPLAKRSALDWTRQPGWRELDAVRNQRVHIVDADRLNRPGPNVIASIQELTRLIRPELQN